MHWSPDDNQTNRSIASLRYQPDDDRVVNLAYRFVRDAVETSDVSFRWPLRHDIGLWAGGTTLWLTNGLSMHLQA